jgi:hypothetical protein
MTRTYCTELYVRWAMDPRNRRNLRASDPRVHSLSDYVSGELWVLLHRTKAYDYRPKGSGRHSIQWGDCPETEHKQQQSFLTNIRDCVCIHF